MTDFEALFHHPADGRASAPGRINLIGEHIDYNGGHVLPLAIPRRTFVEVRLRADRHVHAFSASVDEELREATYERGAEAPGRGWIDYVQGLTHVLDREGHDVPGFELHVTSELPVGSGLASSAALEIAVLRALRSVCGLPLDDVALARIAHLAETEFVGAPVGIMDQMASSLASEDAALFLDTKTRTFTRTPLPRDVEIALIDSGVAHRHASGEYRSRREECQRAAALLNVSLLCDMPLGDLRRAEQLPPPLNRRVRHVLTEEARVLAAVEAMKAGASEQLGRLFVESHVSMRDDYEVSVFEVDILVDAAVRDPDALGARMTGGGFGGAVIILCRRTKAAAVASNVLASHRAAGQTASRIVLPLGA